MMPAKPLLLSLNHVLDQAAWARSKLRPFAGRHARLSVAPVELNFSIGGAGLLQESAAGTFPDVEIILPANAPFLALQGREQLISAARISGSAEFADALGFVLRNLRWDIEEDLSKAVGDIAARRIVGAFDAFKEWQKQAIANLAGNLGEYFTHETSSLVKPGEVSAFTDDVDKLREDLAHLEKRIQQFAD